MIVIGYQGIGKSTLSSNSYSRIDLESSNFWFKGQRPDDWYIYYCQIAMGLSRQGYTVFVSSHKVVRDFLFEHTHERVYVIYPALSLKDEWIRKLELRYNASQLEKDKKAYLNALDRYEDNIQEITAPYYSTNPYFKFKEIDTVNYNLNDIITQAEQYTD